MGVMDYLIGKGAGRNEGRVESYDKGKHYAEMDAIASRGEAEVAQINAQQSQTAALAIAIELRNTREELAITRKRFFKERQKRKGWQKSAEFRKLSLLNRGVTEEQIYAEQDQFSADKEINGRTNQKIDAVSAELDAEFTDETTPSTSNNLSMN